MKKHLIFRALFLCLPLLCNAQQTVTIGDVFCQMPKTMFPYLTNNNKLDLVDFIKSGMKSEVVNEFDDTTKLVKMTDDYILLEASKSLTVEMKLLPADQSAYDTLSTILCVSCSYGEVPAASNVNFYSTNWIPLDIDDPISNYRERIIQRPDTMDGEQYSLICETQHPVMIVARLSESNMTLTLQGNPHIMSATDDKKEQIESIYRQISLKWNGKTFKEN